MIEGQIEQSCHVAADGVGAGGKLLLLGYYGEVGMHEAHVGFGGLRKHLIEQHHRGNVVEGGIVVREQLADVAPGKAAEHGVHEGVEQHVAVGVGADEVFAAYFHAAQHKRTIAAVGVNVVAVAAAGQRRFVFGKQGEILWVGDLDVVPVAFHDEHGRADALHERGVVGDVPAFAVGAFVGFAQRGELEGLRRLHGSQGRTLRRARDKAARVGFLHGVGDGHARNHAGNRTFPQRVGKSGHEGRAQKGARAVVNEHCAAVIRQCGERVTHGILTTLSARGKTKGHAAGFFGVEFERLLTGPFQTLFGKHEHQTVNQRRRGHGARRMPPERRSLVGQKLLGFAARGLGHTAALTGGEDDAPAFIMHAHLADNRMGRELALPPHDKRSRTISRVLYRSEERRLSFL